VFSRSLECEKLTIHISSGEPYEHTCSA
jgi:hypothetical protein